MTERHPRAGISHHFQREAKFMLALFLSAVILGMLAAFIVPRFVRPLPVNPCRETGETAGLTTPSCEESRSG